MWSVIFPFCGKAVTAGELLNPSQRPASSLLFSSLHPTASSNPSPPLHPSPTLPPSFILCCFYFFSLTEEVNGETGSQALTETGRIGGERSCCTQVRGEPTLLSAPSREFPSPFCLTHPPPFASSLVCPLSLFLHYLLGISLTKYLPSSHHPPVFSFCLPHVRLFRCTSPLLYLAAFFFWATAQHGSRCFWVLFFFR